MRELDNELKTLLYKEGVSLIGFANLSDIPNSELPIGVAIAVKIPIDIVIGIHDGPTTAYYETYLVLNEKLNQIVSKGASFLKELVNMILVYIYSYFTSYSLSPILVDFFVLNE